MAINVVGAERGREGRVELLQPVGCAVESKAILRREVCAHVCVCVRVGERERGRVRWREGGEPRARVELLPGRRLRNRRQSNPGRRVRACV